MEGTFVGLNQSYVCRYHRSLLDPPLLVVQTLATLRYFNPRSIGSAGRLSISYAITVSRDADCRLLLLQAAPLGPRISRASYGNLQESCPWEVELLAEVPGGQPRSLHSSLHSWLDRRFIRENSNEIQYW